MLLPPTDWGAGLMSGESSQQVSREAFSLGNQEADSAYLIDSKQCRGWNNGPAAADFAEDLGF